MRTLPKILLSVGFGLVALEAALWIVGFAYTTVHARGAAGEGARRILCLGDSHTFGIWLAKADAYPARLEAKLNEGNPDRWSVENAGVPGYASGDALERLESRLANDRYAAVLVMAGANDRWKGVERASSRPWWRELKTVKLASLLFQTKPAPRITNADGVVHVDEISGKPTPGNADTVTIALVDRAGEAVAFEQRAKGEIESDAGLAAKLGKHLESMARAAAASGARLLFVAYPSEANDLGFANRAMEAAAKAANATYLDFAPTMAKARAAHPFDQLYFPDHHAREATNELLARFLADALADAGVASRRKGGDLLDGLPLRAAAEAPIAVEGEGPAAAALVCRTDPGRRVHFFLAFAEGETDVWGHRIPLARDALFEKTVDPNQPTLTQAVAGPDGRARVPLAGVLGADARAGATIHAVAAIFGREGDAGLHEITPAKALQLK